MWLENPYALHPISEVSPTLPLSLKQFQCLSDRMMAECQACVPVLQQVESVEEKMVLDIETVTLP